MVRKPINVQDNFGDVPFPYIIRKTPDHHLEAALITGFPEDGNRMVVPYLTSIVVLQAQANRYRATQIIISFQSSLITLRASDDST